MIYQDNYFILIKIFLSKKKDVATNRLNQVHTSYMADWLSSYTKYFEVKPASRRRE